MLIRNEGFYDQEQTRERLRKNPDVIAERAGRCNRVAVDTEHLINASELNLAPPYLIFWKWALGAHESCATSLRVQLAVLNYLALFVLRGQIDRRIQLNGEKKNTCQKAWKEKHRSCSARNSTLLRNSKSAVGRQ